MRMARAAFQLLFTCSSRTLFVQQSSSFHCPFKQFKPSLFNFSCNMSSSVISPLPSVQPEEEEKVLEEKKEDEELIKEAQGITSILLPDEEEVLSKDEVLRRQIAAEEKKERFQRIRKKKCVIMLSYCGHGYYGMQKNFGMKTIEEELLGSLLKNEYIDDETFERPQSSNFQRAARTDKNVSAARQIVSLKLPDDVSIKRINHLLPPEIRVMGIKRVTKGFDAKNQCDGRTYSYMLPTFAFAPLETHVTEAYRLPLERIHEIQKILGQFLGTKNHHNFTSRKRPNDPSAMRRIIDFKCGQPFEKGGLEFLILRVRGQSFMLHQIRKMIGLTIAYMRGFASLDTFEKVWSLNRVDVPRAPGVGLMLDYVHYDRYDHRYGSDGMHDALTWDSYDDEVVKFCDDYIYPIVTKAENEDKSMLEWLTTLPYHTYDIREPVPEDATEREKNKSQDSRIGHAYRAVVHSRDGEEPAFSKRGKTVDIYDDDEGEDDTEAKKKPRIQVALDD